SFPLSIREEGTKDHASHADHRGGAIAVAVPPGVRPHRSPLGPSAPGTLLMSDSPPVDVTNPQLDEAEIAALAAYGTRRGLQDGEPLFQVGERRGGFYIVLSGAIEVHDRSGDEPRT